MGPRGTANLNSPAASKAKKAKTPADTPSKSSSNGASEQPVKAKPDSRQSFVIRPAAATNFKSAMKVYMNLETLRGLGLASGDPVVVAKRGERGIVGLITPSATSIKQDTVELPRVLRKLGGFLLGDRVTVAKNSKRPDFALRVVVGSKHEIQQHSEKIKSILDDIGIVCPGIRFDVDEGIEVVVTDVEGMPRLDKLSLDGPNEDDVISQPMTFDKSRTELELSHSTSIKAQGLPRVSGYSAIGGLSKVINKLKAAIELPLHHPNLFGRFNSTPERGFLLHGPPGTGKTMLLRAVAQESEAHVLTINGPSIVSKYLGETEEALRNIFEEARSYQPSIIFIDEIDSLVPKRDSDDSGEAESRVVSTMLTLMDGMGSAGKVCVVGATNRPNQIDPALRRPGRFGTEFEIGIPDVAARLDILQLQLSGQPHKLSEEYIQSLASRTHGYVGSDINALWRDAVMRTIQRGLANSTPENDIFVETDDLEKALIDIRPSAMREVVLETPKVFWTDIGGQEDAKKALFEAIELPMSKPETFKRLGIQAPRGILLYGPPGCSKTLIAKALATEAGLNFLAVKGPEIFNKFVGESERAIREVFRKARAAAPSIIFFDEIDALSAARGHGEAGGDRVLTSLLNEMDGIEALNGVTVLAATNVPDVIDNALMRPGRLDRLVYVAPPDLESRKMILEIRFRKMSINSDVSVDDLAARTEGCSGAEVVSLCQEAGLAAMSEDFDIGSISQRHFEVALSKIKKAITPEMLQYYEEFSKQGKL
ncbi:ATPase family gene 2 protein [Trichomonascus vanleenenianus]|uniref:AAA family ATPase AFG2 n=1 Tax=Trichomonascus vanleenenianus TaxID=2268995 RepID=UPI003ECABE31